MRIALTVLAFVLGMILFLCSCATRPLDPRPSTLAAPTGPRWIAELDTNALPLRPHLLSLFDSAASAIEASLLDPQLSVIIPAAPPIARVTTNFTLQWVSTNTDPEVFVNLYYGPGGRVYSGVVRVNGTNCTLILPMGEQYHFAVTTADDFGDESEFSDECTAFGGPLVLKLHFAGVQAPPLESSADLFNWSVAADALLTNGDWYVTRASPKPSEFFRQAE